MPLLGSCLHLARAVFRASNGWSTRQVTITKQCPPKSHFKSCTRCGASSREDNWVLTKSARSKDGMQDHSPVPSCHPEALIMLFTDQIIWAMRDKKQTFQGNASNTSNPHEKTHPAHLIGMKPPCFLQLRVRPDALTTPTLAPRCLIYCYFLGWAIFKKHRGFPRFIGRKRILNDLLRS